MSTFEAFLKYEVSLKFGLILFSGILFTLHLRGQVFALLCTVPGVLPGGRWGLGREQSSPQGASALVF